MRNQGSSGELALMNGTGAGLAHPHPARTGHRSPARPCEFQSLRGPNSPPCHALPCPAVALTWPERQWAPRQRWSWSWSWRSVCKASGGDWAICPGATGWLHQRPSATLNDPLQWRPDSTTLITIAPLPATTFSPWDPGIGTVAVARLHLALN